jgi:ferredoxin
MCQFCAQHGEGKKWYLEARNYSQDLLSDKRRQARVLKLMSGSPEEKVRRALGMDAQMDRLNNMPALIRKVVDWRVAASLKQVHYGQVLPIEDVARVFDLVTSITRIPCTCRQMALGTEQRYCYGICTVTGGGKLHELSQAAHAHDEGVRPMNSEHLTKEEALESFHHHEHESLCHTVWTMGTPFIFAVCNCDRGDCMAMRSTLTHKLPMFFRGEYVAEVDAAACTGCRSCMKACQFGALAYSAAQGKAMIEPRTCYGCGTCRAWCPRNAITLRDRATVPAAANLW